MVHNVPVRFCLFLTGNVLGKVMKPPSVRYRGLAPGNSVPVGFWLLPVRFWHTGAFQSLVVTVIELMFFEGN